MPGRGAEGWRVSRAPRAPNMASWYKPGADRSPLSCPSKQDGRLLRPRAALAVRLEWAPSGRQPQRCLEIASNALLFCHQECIVLISPAPRARRLQAECVGNSVFSPWTQLPNLSCSFIKSLATYHRHISHLAACCRGSRTLQIQNVPCLVFFFKIKLFTAPSLCRPRFT